MAQEELLPCFCQVWEGSSGLQGGFTSGSWLEEASPQDRCRKAQISFKKFGFPPVPPKAKASPHCHPFYLQGCKPCIPSNPTMADKAPEEAAAVHGGNF